MLNVMVLAATEGEDPFSPVSPQLTEVIWAAVFSILLFLIVRRVAWPKLQAALAARQAAIAGSIEAAEATKAEADGVLAEYRAKLADAQTEAQRIIDEGRRTGEKIVADARARADVEAQALLTRPRPTSRPNGTGRFPRCAANWPTSQSSWPAASSASRSTPPPSAPWSIPTSTSSRRARGS